MPPTFETIAAILLLAAIVEALTEYLVRPLRTAADPRAALRRRGLWRRPLRPVPRRPPGHPGAVRPLFLGRLRRHRLAHRPRRQLCLRLCRPLAKTNAGTLTEQTRGLPTRASLLLSSLKAPGAAHPRRRVGPPTAFAFSPSPWYAPLQASEGCSFPRGERAFDNQALSRARRGGQGAPS